MKEFDLELAKQGHPVCTRDGRKARIICFDRKANKYPIIALIQHKDNELEDYACFTINGKRNAIYPNGMEDLMMETKTVTKWANIYPDTTGQRIILFDTKEDAEALVAQDFLSHGFTAKVEWEE